MLSPTPIAVAKLGIFPSSNGLGSWKLGDVIPVGLQFSCDNTEHLENYLYTCNYFAKLQTDRQNDSRISKELNRIKLSFWGSPKFMVQNVSKSTTRIRRFRNRAKGASVFGDLRNCPFCDGNSRAHVVAILRGFNLRVAKVVI